MDETEILQEIRGDKIEYKKYLCRRNLRTKYKVMRAYGGKCVCCGESTLSFLTIDHPNNDGVKDRLAHGVGSTFYRWLKKGATRKGIVSSALIVIVVVRLMAVSVRMRSREG